MGTKVPIALNVDKQSTLITSLSKKPQREKGPTPFAQLVAKDHTEFSVDKRIPKKPQKDSKSTGGVPRLTNYIKQIDPTNPTLPKQRIIPASISQSQESSQRPYSIQAGLKDPPKQLQHHEEIARIPKVEIIDIISAPPSPSVDIGSPIPDNEFQQKLHTEMFAAGKDGLERRKFLRYLCGYSEE